MSILKRKIEIADKNPTSGGSPIPVIKNIEALSRIPKSPKEIDGMNDLTKSVNIPANKNDTSIGFSENPAVSIPYWNAIIPYSKNEKKSCKKTVRVLTFFRI